jgi:FkbM family methyltransferase
MKVFLDVGAHEGSTLLAVRDPKYAFERIYCFEPASSCWPFLESLADSRVVVCRFGLSNHTTEQTLYDPGSRGASLYADKFKDTPAQEQIQLVRASSWFREHIEPTDDLFVKLNCEGAEVDIVDDLLEHGLLAQVHSVMIDPDVRKIPSQSHRERELRERLRASGLANYALEDEVMVGATHRARIQYWLRGAGAEERTLGARARQAAYVVRAARHGHREPLRAAFSR